MPTCTPMQAATEIGCSIATIYRKANTGELAPVSSAARIEFDAAHVADLIARRSAAEQRSMSVTAAAQRLGVSRAGLYGLVYRGRLERYPLLYGEMRVTNESVERWMSARDAASAA